MALFKEVWSFSSPDTGTWSETAISQGDSLTNAATFGRTFLAGRLALLNKINTLQKIKVSELGNPRSSQVVTIGRSGTDDQGGPAADGLALVVNLSSSAVPSSRRWWCRGISANMVNRDPVTGAHALSPLTAASLSAWLALLEFNKYCVAPLTRVGINNVAYNSITGVDGTIRNGVALLTLQNNAAFAVGSKIDITQVDQKHFPGLKGTFNVESVAGNIIGVRYVTPEGVARIVEKGRVKQHIIMPGAIIRAKTSGFKSIGVRKSRNQVFSSRGARSAQRLRS